MKKKFFFKFRKAYDSLKPDMVVASGERLLPTKSCNILIMWSHGFAWQIKTNISTLHFQEVCGHSLEY